MDYDQYCINEAVDEAGFQGSFAQYFPLGRIYAGEKSGLEGLIREPRSRFQPFPYSERHLQAVWYDGQWRPANLVTATGEMVRVEYPGRWNLEAGPDFLGATIVVGSNERRITGDVEIHIHPADWKRHGHDNDKRYRNVCLHVTYYDGILPDEALPPGTLQLSLRSQLQSDPSFAFEHIDVAVYPYAGRADLPPCRIQLAEWPIESKVSLLEAAGQERLRRKAIRLGNDINDCGVDQAFYCAVLSSLGYQHNRKPFHTLSRLFPLDRLRVLSRGKPKRAYALLAGVAGLLPEKVDPRWDIATRLYVRSLWDIWWKEKGAFARTMQKSDWRLGSVRPLNHPLRRLVSAAHVFAGAFDVAEVVDAWVGGTAKDMMSALHAFMEPDEESYWLRRVSLGGQLNKTPASIVGNSRLYTIALNVVIPMAVALGLPPERVGASMAGIKPEPFNQFMRQAGFYLFGPDAPASLYDVSVRRQGLLQIFHDYCMQDRSRCSQCRLPEKLGNLGQKIDSAPWI